MAKNVLTHEGYVARYLELVGENQQHRRCCQMAWTRTETELRTAHGVKRYTSLSSFQVCRSKGVTKSNLTPLTEFEPIVLP